MAVRVGFEPTEPVKVQRFSRPPDSTALAPHRFLIVPFPDTYTDCHYAGFLERVNHLPDQSVPRTLNLLAQCLRLK